MYKSFGNVPEHRGRVCLDPRGLGYGYGAAERNKRKKKVSEAGLLRAVQNLRLMKGNCEIKEQSEL